ncbi:MAG TPA: hypothetical protein VFL93_12280, partial [Longimicrobiaceae bacterium]|nr:hypothetical protein [Longimicrobiaceae bacterium]
MSAAAMNLARLRAQLEERFGSAILPADPPAPAREAPGGLRTGVIALDALLPAGVPRGALSLWTGAGTSGRTAAVRALVETTSRSGARIAVVDAARTLDAGFGSVAGVALGGVWVAR